MKFFKKASPQLKTICQRAVMLSVCMTFMISMINFCSRRLTLAEEVSVKDEVIGYVQNKNEIEKAKNLVVHKTEIKKEKIQTTSKSVVVEVDMLSGVNDLSKKIISSPKVGESGYGLYIGEVNVATTKKYSQMAEAINKAKMIIRAGKNVIDISVKTSYTIKKDIYSKGTFMSVDTAAIKIKDAFTAKSYIITKSINQSISYETKYIDNLDKAIGYSKVLKNGKEGIKKVTYDITYQGDAEIASKKTSEKVMIKSVTRVIEVGTKEADCAHFLQKDKLALPVGKHSYFISSRFGPRWGGIHHGIDFAVGENTNIYAADAGVVKKVESKNASYGNYIIIEHTNGISTLYAHLNKALVKVGQKVAQGQFVAKSGNTGNSTGPHLHFEYRINNIAQNPEFYLGIKIE